MEPTSLQEAILYFSTPANCREYLVARRWPDGVTCPHCGSKNVLFLEKYNRWECREKHDARQFTLKTGTIFEDSPIGLEKWLPVMWMVVNCKNGVSSWEIHRAIKVTQKSAWFMLQRCRLAMQDNLTGGSLAGEVEVDETYIGGKARNMHKDRKVRVQKAGRNTGGKSIVMGMLERKGKVRATVIPDRTKATMQPIVGPTWNPALRSTLMSTAPIGRWMNTSTAWSTILRRTWTVTFTPTVWRISGAC